MKHYFPPQLRVIAAMAEGEKRSLAATVLLSPSPVPQIIRLCVSAMLFQTEYETAQTVCTHAVPQLYAVELHPFFTALTTAADCVFRHRRHTFRLRGTAAVAVVQPRYLQLTLVHLLATHTDLSVCLDLRDRLLRIDGLPRCADLPLTRTLAAVQGDRLLQTEQTLFWQFSKAEKTACPRWQSPRADGLIHDCTSPVYTGACYSACTDISSAASDVSASIGSTSAGAFSVSSSGGLSSQYSENAVANKPTPKSDNPAN